MNGQFSLLTRVAVCASCTLTVSPELCSGCQFSVGLPTKLLLTDEIQSEREMRLHPEKADEIKIGVSRRFQQAIMKLDGLCEQGYFEYVAYLADQ